jgi:AAA15 family ATPase/GTPase
MLKEINITNFRCFKELLVENLQQVNLFTGKNNAGKTSLLEAIHSGLRKEMLGITKTIRNIDIAEYTDSKIFEDNTHQQNNENIIFDMLFYDNGDFSYTAVVNADGQWEHPVSPKFSNRIQFKNTVTSEIHTVFITERKKQLPQLADISKLYDSYEIKGLKNTFIDAVKIIDPGIEEIRTFSSYPNALFYRRINEEKFYLVEYLGDAAKKIITIIANIVFHFSKNKTGKNNFLFIDEIENGLHYTVQKEFWQILIKLCVQYDVQLFATTHSKEMLEAYCEVSKQFNNVQGYFELVKDYKQDIVCINHSMELLAYELQKNEEIRG